MTRPPFLVSGAPFAAPALALALALAAPAAAQAPAAPVANDYPTQARVDYVLGCMATNGNTREAVRKCSCSIDFIAGEISYADYTAVETAMAMQNMPGDRGSMMRDAGWIKDLLDRFRQAQVAADLECFARTATP
ncbi:MAG TPA: hypothetical protein VEB20_10560 [Azospirillaceae bacterium]|nr:hypothetical protein [Azospirillaceae bacterium]